MRSRPAGYLAWAYRALLRCYPRGYRERFGGEMLATFQAAQEEAARAGPMAVLRLWLREVRDWPLCLLQQRLARAREVREVRVKAPRDAGWSSAEQPDGRWAAAEARPVVLLFLVYGLAQALGTYLSPLIAGHKVLWTAMSAALTLAVAGLLLAGLIVAGCLRFPRWGFPYLGQTLGVLSLFVMLGSTRQPAVAVVFVLALVGLVALAAARGLLGRLWRDPTLVSLTFYGFLPIALLIAFDDRFSNYITPCVALAAVALPAGAWLYTRCGRAWQRYPALWLGAMACLSLALLDLAHFAGGVDVAVRTVDGVTPAGHILGLMRDMTVLLLGPALLVPLRRIAPWRPSW